MRKDKLEVRHFKGQQGMKELQADWQNLMRDVSNQCFYHQPEWFDAFLEVYSSIGRSLHFFAIYRGSKVVAVFPVLFGSRGKFFRIKEASLPLMRQLYMTDCVISDGEDSAQVVTRFLDSIKAMSGRQWDVFTARGTLECSQISLGVRQLGRYKRRSKPTDSCSLVPVQPYETALKAMKPKVRQNLVRRKRRIAELGKIERSVESSPADVARAFSEFVELEASGWKAGKGKLRGNAGLPLAIKLNSEKHEFYRRVLTSLALRGIVEIHCLRLDERLIAARIWLVFNDCCYAIKTAYDESYGRFSPGALTFEQAYKHQSERGDIRYINPIYEQPALEGWQPDTIQYCDHFVFNNTMKGGIAAVAYSCLSFLRRLLS